MPELRGPGSGFDCRLLPRSLRNSGKVKLPGRTMPGIHFDKVTFNKLGEDQLIRVSRLRRSGGRIRCRGRQTCTNPYAKIKAAPEIHILHPLCQSHVSARRGSSFPQQWKRSCSSFLASNNIGWDEAGSFRISPANNRTPGILQPRYSLQCSIRLFTQVEEPCFDSRKA